MIEEGRADDLDISELPVDLSPFAEEIVGHFWILDSRRQWNFGSPNPITWFDLMGYIALTGAALSAWMIGQIVDLDNAYLEAFYLSRPSK
jgi:hypothetical protein